MMKDCVYWNLAARAVTILQVHFLHTHFYLGIYATVLDAQSTLEST